MGRAHIITQNAASNALPSGGRCDDALRGVSKTVDRPTSSFDRRRHHIPRKEQHSSKIFQPLEQSEMPKPTNRGKSLHSDPFSADRSEITVRRSRVKVATPRGPERPERRHTRVAPQPGQSAKPGFITANGVRFTSPKRTTKERMATTYDRAQPPKSYTGSRRFLSSPTRQRALEAQAHMAAPTAARTTDGSAVTLGAAVAPAAETLASSREPLSLSNVFTKDGVAAAQPQRHQGIRIDSDRYRAVTMEGVFSPMRNGRAPKPSTLAPWMQETHVPASGRKSIAAPAQSTESPFAIEA